MKNNIEQYDLQKLKQAHNLINQVYSYYYGVYSMKKETDRLETILNKLEFLIKGGANE